ncbi:MAG: ROK family protein [Enterocloster sp.]
MLYRRFLRRTLDSGRGVILSPPNLIGWDQVPVVSYLEQRLGTDAGLKNVMRTPVPWREWRVCGAGRAAATHDIPYLRNRAGAWTGFKRKGYTKELAAGGSVEAGHVRLAEEGPVGYTKKRRCLGGLAAGEGLRGWPGPWQRML